MATDKSDFDAIENIRNDDWFKRCMGIRQMPSSSRLHQRFDEGSSALMPMMNDSLAEVVVNL
ncbi:MAG: IS1380 family transposase, partial [Endozoicomonadaceae bacterium]|nr:IS1380 family transposase [Endozoicomonadaceae bacterium]